MCTHRREPGAAFWWRRYSRRFGSREDWLDRLEEYQRDLEQELADVADIIRRLQEDKPPEPASV